MKSRAELKRPASELRGDRPATPGGGAHRLSEAASKLTRRALGAVGPDGVAPDQQLRASYRNAAQGRRGNGPPRGNAADAGDAARRRLPQLRRRRRRCRCVAAAAVGGPPPYLIVIPRIDHEMQN